MRYYNKIIISLINLIKILYKKYYRLYNQYLTKLGKGFLIL